MPSKYKRVIGGRNYLNYTQETLAQAVEDVRNRTLSQRKAAELYKVPVSTIKNKLKNKHAKSHGGQPVFTKTEEEAFTAHICTLSHYGFPLDQADLRFLVKSYLDREGRTVGQFKDNLPAKDWLKSFLKRNPTLTQRFASNIKRSRAEVNEETLTKYFDHLKNEIKDVPANFIWNYDETNLSDDPGRKRILTKRGTKYPERVLNFSKSATSIMFCGNAAGEMLPPYVVYKSDKLWSTWVENGPNGARYNRSKSGWFDTSCFEDWFGSLVLPTLKKIPGKKVLIGDNLSSHISLKVLEQCEAENIKFVCLPPNSTHLTQPLDVAYFRPMKIVWRNILVDFKSQNIKSSLIPKSIFPQLLKKLLDAIELKGGKNLENGFKKCGIVPLEKGKVLERLPNYKPNEENADNISTRVSDVVLKFLAEKRGLQSSEPPIKRRKKIEVIPGKSISSEDLKKQEVMAAQIKINKKKPDVRKKKFDNDNKRRKNKIDVKQQKKNEKPIEEINKILENNEKESESKIKEKQKKEHEIKEQEKNEMLTDTNREPNLTSEIFSQKEMGNNLNKEDAVLPGCSKIQLKHDKKKSKICKKRKTCYDISESSASESECSVSYMDESDSEEFLSNGDYVIVTDHLECFPGKFDTYAKDNRHGWVLQMVHVEGRTWQWPETSVRQLYHLADIDAVQAPTKISENLYVFSTL